MGIGKAFRYLVTYPEKYEFEAKNPSTLFVALSRAKSASGRGSDPDFAFHEDVLLNDDRLKLVNTPTTQARQTEMQGLCLLANQCKEMEAFSLAYQEETFTRLVEWAESQSHQWAWGCVQDLNTTSAVFCWCGWENVRHPSSMCQLPNFCAGGSCPNLVVADASSLNVEQMAATQILLADALTQAANNPWLRLLGNLCYWPHRIRL